MSNCQVSVVIPTFNRRSEVEQALKSVFQQSVKVDEIIVVDDGSTDLISELFSAKIDPRIDFIRLEQNVGGAVARNVGLAAASGDFVAFLDSDDTWLPTKIEEQLRALSKKPKAVASFTGIRHVFSDRIRDAFPPPEVSLARLRQSNAVGSASTAVIRRDAVAAVGGFDAALPSCHDWDMWLRLRILGEFAVVTKPLIIYHHDAPGRISRNRLGVLLGHDIVFARCMAGLPEVERRTASAYHAIRLAEVLLFELNDPWGALTHSLKSSRQRPTFRALHLCLRSLGCLAVTSMGPMLNRAKRSRA